MFFEYIQLTGMGGAPFSQDFLSRVIFLVVAGLVLAVVGFKIKGVWGAVLALAAGVVWFLYNERMIRF
jgi:hypothetical protein